MNQKAARREDPKPISPMPGRKVAIVPDPNERTPAFHAARRAFLTDRRSAQPPCLGRTRGAEAPSGERTTGLRNLPFRTPRFPRRPGSRPTSRPAASIRVRNGRLVMSSGRSLFFYITLPFSASFVIQNENNECRERAAGTTQLHPGTRKGPGQ